MAPVSFKWWKRMEIAQLVSELLSNNHCSCPWQELNINCWAKRGTLIKILINLSGTSAVVICWMEKPVRTGNNMGGYCKVTYTLVIVTFFYWNINILAFSSILLGLNKVNIILQTKFLNAFPWKKFHYVSFDWNLLEVWSQVCNWPWVNITSVTILCWIDDKPLLEPKVIPFVDIFMHLLDLIY